METHIVSEQISSHHLNRKFFIYVILLIGNIVVLLSSSYLYYMKDSESIVNQTLSKTTDDVVGLKIGPTLPTSVGNVVTSSILDDSTPSSSPSPASSAPASPSAATAGTATSATSAASTASPPAPWSPLNGTVVSRFKVDISTLPPPATTTSSAGDSKFTSKDDSKNPFALVPDHTSDQANQPKISFNHSGTAERANKCPKGSFICGDSSQCMEQFKQCNYITDCDNGFDEQDCDKNKFGAASVFFGSVDPTRVDPNEEKDILKPLNCSLEIFKLEACPCNLDDPYVVICDNNQLKNMPRNLTNNLKRLKLKNNLIEAIDISLPSSILSLNLNNNLIKTIDPLAFKNAFKLDKLYLRGNLLTTIEAETFATLINLVSLDLTNNRLVTFDPGWLKNSPNLKTLSLDYNMIKLDRKVQFRQFQKLEKLFLENNSIDYISSGMFTNMERLYWLELQRNRIAHIEPGSFYNNPSLVEVKLGNNNLKNLSRNIFPDNLESLWLNYNPITSLPVDVFDGLTKLSFISLEGITIDNISVDHFENLNLQHIHFSQYKYCRFARSVRVCRPNSDGISDVNHLLIYPFLQYAVWVVAFVCCFGNISVLIWRLLSKQENPHVSIFIMNLSVADLMMGFYLCAIGWTDSFYWNEYNKYAYYWMTSWRCTAFGFLAMLSSELSVFILLLYTIERYRYSVSTEFNGDEVACKTKIHLLLVWIISFSIAVYPIFHWSKTGDHVYYATNGLCLPLHIHEPFTSGWEYSAFIFVGINSSAMFIIIAMYVLMYIKLRRTSKRVKISSPNRRREEDAVLAVRFFFIVLVFCMCYLPIIAIKLNALFNKPVNATVYTFIAVFILPINSALNPVIYTLFAPSGLNEFVCALLNRLYRRSEAFLKSKDLIHYYEHHKKRKDTSVSSVTCDTLATSDTAKSSTAGLLTGPSDNGSSASRHSTPPSSRRASSRKLSSYNICRCYKMFNTNNKTVATRNNTISNNNSNNNNNNNNNNNVNSNNSYMTKNNSSQNCTTTTAIELLHETQLAAQLSQRKTLPTETTGQLQQRIVENHIDENVITIHELLDTTQQQQQPRDIPLLESPPPYSYENTACRHNDCDNDYENVSTTPFLSHRHDATANKVSTLVLIPTTAQTNTNTTNHIQVKRGGSPLGQAAATAAANLTTITINYISGGSPTKGPSQSVSSSSVHSCLESSLQYAQAVRGINNL